MSAVIWNSEQLVPGVTGEVCCFPGGQPQAATAEDRRASLGQEPGVVQDANSDRRAEIRK